MARDDHDVQGCVASLLATCEIERRGINALREALAGNLGVTVAKAIEVIEGASGKLVVSGMGKSGHIGAKIAATMASTGTYSHFVHPAEASHGDLGMVREDDVVLALSWSGETPELASLVDYTRRFNVKLIAITARGDSALAKAADVALVLPGAEEACPNGLAPTTSTTMQLVLGDALAISLLRRRNFTAKEFYKYHPGGKLGAKFITVGQIMHTGGEIPLVPLGVNLSDGIYEMTAKRLGVVGVTDARHKLVGVVTDGDLRRAFQDGVSEKSISQVMSSCPISIDPDQLAQRALSIMNEARITTLFVTKDGKVVGILHIHDVLKAGTR